MKLIESEHVVGPDGSITIRELQPGATARVMVIQYTDANRRVDPAKYQRPAFHYERPFDPACDPQEWDALR